MLDAPAGGIVGAFVDTEGNPLADITVVTRGLTSDGAPGTSGHAQTDTEGRYEIPGLAAGTYILMAMKMGDEQNVHHVGIKHDIPVELGATTTVDWIIEPGCDLHVVMPVDETLPDEVMQGAIILFASSPKDDVIGNDLMAMEDPQKLDELFAQNWKAAQAQPQSAAA